MTETSVHKIFNSTNQGSEEHLILCTEFLHYRIRILILRNNNDPLLGEVTTSELWKNAKDAFPESEEEFHKETRNVLSGKAENYQFSLENNKFIWGKDIWTRGCIEVFCESEIAVLSDFMINVLTNVVHMQKNIESINQENKQIKKNLTSLHCQLEDMIKMKNEMETVLLKKFILILNEKKKKIRELQAELKDLKTKIEPSVYDLSTDDELTDEEVKKIKEEETEKKIIELDDTSSHLENDFSSPKPSTSKQNHEIAKERGLSTPSPRKSSLLEDEFEDIINHVVNLVPSSGTRNAEISNEKIVLRSAKVPRKYLTFEESDEDIELKLDTIDKSKITQLNITDEEPEVDLFSQSF